MVSKSVYDIVKVYAITNIFMTKEQKKGIKAILCHSIPSS